MSALAIEAVEPAPLALDAVTRDPDLACRARGVNHRTVSEYAAAMKTGAAFPPVIVFVDSKGVRWLADGFHRCAAADLAGLTEIAADVREGSRKDALLYAAKANGEHGLRRTNADKRRAVLLVLGNFPKWSDRKIGEACGVDHKTVAAARAANAAQAEGGEIPQNEGEPPGPTLTSERTIERLSKALDRLLAEWPADRRSLLAERLKALLAE